MTDTKPASNPALMSTYAPLPVTFSHGEGITLTDTNGKTYLDALMGIAVCGLGHCHPAVTATIQEQSQRLLHTSNVYHIEHQERLGALLADISGMERSFFCNSGAEANECAIKLARLYGHTKAIELPSIIVVEGAFHGRTLATLTATANRKAKAGFEPLARGFVRAPFNDIEAIQTIAANNTNVVAVMVEPVQGEGGINIPSANYLAELRRICDAQGWLLILDEIQTGNGRTGRYFAYQHHNIKPDIVTTAKGLGNGFPIGACLAQGTAAELFSPGQHGTTYGGNPLACAVGATVVNTLNDAALMTHTQQLSERFITGFNARLGHLEHVKEIRGCGLLLGLEMTTPCGELVNQALAAGLLINVTAGNVVRLLPALTTTDSEADQIIAQLSDVILNWAEHKHT